MLVVLSGAKKNIGDFLIVDRACKLIESILGEEIVVLPRWKSLDAHEETVAKARAVVVGGGPGVLPSMYPQIYPLFSDPGKLRELGVPLRLLGVGWFASRGDAAEMRRFAWTPETKAFLDTIGDALAVSTRDAVTRRLLLAKGLSDVTMSGCPVFYDLRHLGEPYRRPADVKTVVYTTPQSPRFTDQNLQLLRAVIERFPGAKVIAAFHRGLAADEFTTPAEAERFGEMARRCAELGAEVRDVSYDLDNIAFYDDCDFHIGYRVHAHLRFISGRKPSVLLEEDGRGRGFAEVLPAPSIRAWTIPSLGRALLPALPYAPRRLERRFSRIEAAPDTVERTMVAVDAFIAGDDAPYERAVEAIEATYPVMKGFIERV
ncbi:MAG: polysaccharide pyruvyl transferase family protein [Coriobacteriia bacterium]|nr:polysaccharide pyruvyl transferase family protein [Coriobacteriia bacterium]